jgi:hypothetical protein
MCNPDCGRLEKVQVYLLAQIGFTFWEKIKFLSVLPILATAYAVDTVTLTLYTTSSKNPANY